MPDITIYTKVGCPYCAAAKEDLAKRGVEYDEIDVHSSPKAKAEAINLAGGQAVVPVIVEDGKVTVGFGGS